MVVMGCVPIVSEPGKCEESEMAYYYRRRTVYQKKEPKPNIWWCIITVLAVWFGFSAGGFGGAAIGLVVVSFSWGLLGRG